MIIYPRISARALREQAKGRPLRSSCLGDLGDRLGSREPSRVDFGRSTAPIEPTSGEQAARGPHFEPMLGRCWIDFWGQPWFLASFCEMVASTQLFAMKSGPIEPTSLPCAKSSI